MILIGTETVVCSYAVKKEMAQKKKKKWLCLLLKKEL